MIMSIFKPCDIRGVYPDELDETQAELVARAVGSEIAGADCVVAGDVRLSTPALKEAVRRGLVASGVHVLDIGIAPTPVAYWAQRHLGAHGVLVVTASHNPPEYNGMKLMLGDMPVTPDDVARVRRRVEQQSFASGTGSVSMLDVHGDYVNWLIERFGGTGPRQRVLVDAGNGVASHWAPGIFRACGYAVEEIFCEPDGRFPHRSPNPSSRDALAEASARMQSGGIDFAACFDGDGDRVVFLDAAGHYIPAEQALILFARHALPRHAGASVVYDLKCTRVVPREIERHGGRPVKERSGHAFIKRRLIDEDAILAGEASGHFFFHELAGDDGIYAALRMGEVLMATGRSLAELLADIPSYFISDDIRLASDDPPGAVDRVRRAFADHPQDDMDGVCVEFSGGWALCRASVTEPAITLRVEGDSAERVEEIKHEVLTALGEDRSPTSA